MNEKILIKDGEENILFRICRNNTVTIQSKSAQTGLSIVAGRKRWKYYKKKGYSRGNSFWYDEKGELHREGHRPAIIWSDGSQEWWINGELHMKMYENGGLRVK